MKSEGIEVSFTNNSATFKMNGKTCPYNNNNAVPAGNYLVDYALKNNEPDSCWLLKWRL